MREATPEEAGPTWPGAMVARGRAPFAFQAGRDFERLDNDRAIATLLSQMEKPAIQGRPPGPCVERLDPAIVGMRTKATPGIVGVAGRSVGVVRLAITEKGRSMIAR
jgi:hypothetical protein